jgi:non-canonical purine NTP pyrophosphatase (RdgB/HAM1 family)
MKQLTFITGNTNKAEQIARHLDYPLLHKAFHLDEIQSLDSHEIVLHKAKQAYDQIQSPVLIEDTSLQFHALGRLPGPFIKWFLDELGNEKLCRLLDPFDDRSATALVTFAIYDGGQLQTFDATKTGTIAHHPSGTMGFGWDPIFINEGFEKTRGEMTQEEYDQASPRKAAIEKLHEYLKHR